MKKSKRIVLGIIIGVIAVLISACILTVILYLGRIQYTPQECENTKWVASNVDAYFEVDELGRVTGELICGDETIRIHLAWVGGTPSLDILDADKSDAGHIMNDEVILISGSGYWKNRNTFIVKISSDNVGIGVDKIIFEKEA